MKSVLAGIRYLLTGTVALLLVLLLVELGGAIDLALEHAHENASSPGNFGGSVTGEPSESGFVEGGS